jgi:uncharacterized protein (TIGR02145 family)
MKRLLKIIGVVFLSIVFIALIHTCKKMTVPVVTTLGVSGITQTSAVYSGNVLDDGGAEVLDRGIYFDTTQTLITSGSGRRTLDGKGTGSFSSRLGGLSVNTKYYICAYATNREGTGFGETISFTTYGVLPATVSTTIVTSITSSTAISGGFVYGDGAGRVTSRGVCWAKFPNPSISDSKTEDGSGLGSFISKLTQLEVNNTYYVRAYATNEVGTAYGELRSFITREDLSHIIFNPDLTYGSVSDIDGNNYKTIKIGTQEWMAENLRTSRYNDGRPIGQGGGNTWVSSSSPLYCLNRIYETYTNALGAYYNWYVVETGKLCPSDWHVPTDNEWTELSTYLDGDSIAGGKLKETGTIHWYSPNTDATNETGFSALPGGYGMYDGYKDLFKTLGESGAWWSSTEPYDCCGGSAFLSYNNSRLYVDSMGKSAGCSVRCIKD